MSRSAEEKSNRFQTGEPVSLPGLRFLWRWVRPHRRALLAASALVLLGSAVMLSMPWFAGQVVTRILAGEIPSGLMLAWFAAMVALAVLGYLQGLVLGYTHSRITTALVTDVYDHLQSLPLGWHQARKRGEVLALLGNDVWRLSAFIALALVPLAPLLLTCVGALVLLLRIEPWTGLAVAICVPVLVLGMKYATRKLRPLAQAASHEDAVRAGIAAQNLSVLAALKAYTREGEESLRFRAQSERVQLLEFAQLRIESLLGPAVRLVASAAILMLLLLGGESVAAGDMAPADLVAMLLYGLLLAQPVSQLAGAYGNFQTARGSAQRISDALMANPEPTGGDVVRDSAKGELVLESVTFSYPGRPQVLAGIDLVLRAGETVALTGANGAGKTTLVHLLMRFADPDAGRILLDGIDIRDYALRNLRSHIGLVSQQVLLTNTTIAENIAYGRPGASQAQLEQAARAAHAHDFISRLPDGYGTVIGDDGVRLSGGQRQRLSLARALLKDPAVLVLDEATAMFDPEGERNFIAECHDLLRDRTVVLITHRPASLALADRILRLDAGVLAEVPR